MSNLAPTPKFPERPGTQFERKASNDPRDSYNGSRRGPLRFEEGVGTDTDVPSDFNTGVMQGYVTGARPNQNANVYEKPAAETMKERAHVGSAAWVESNDYLSEFAHGSFSDAAEVQFESVKRNGARQQRQSPAVVTD